MSKNEENPFSKGEDKGADGVGFTLVAFAAVTVATAFYAIVRIVDVPEDAVANLTDKSDIVRNIGLFALGTIGLPLAIWRSWIAKQQVDEAIAQGRRTERQLLHAERQLQSSETTALLGVIEKAGGLLAENALSARTTGVHLLESVMDRDAGSLTAAATEILYQFARDNENKSGSDHYVACLALLKFASKRAMREDILSIDGDYQIDIKLEAGIVSDITIYSRSTSFSNCDFTSCVITGYDTRFDRCNIATTLVVDIHPKSRGTSFTDSDFSFSKVSTVGENCEFIDCYYHAETPPTDECLKLLGDKLDVRPGRSPFFKSVAAGSPG